MGDEVAAIEIGITDMGLAGKGMIGRHQADHLVGK